MMEMFRSLRRRSWLGIAARTGLLVATSCAPEANTQPELLDLRSLEQPINYPDNSCTTYQNSINEQEVYALTSIRAAAHWASKNNGLYSRSFGIWNSTRADVVQAVFDDVLANWDDFEVDCGDSTCQANPTYSGYSNADPDLFHLCARWLTLKSGISATISTMTGTLDHEKVHVVSTVVDEDHGDCSVDGCYGAANVIALANADADLAVNSADNYNFFAMQAHGVSTIWPSVWILGL